MSGGIPTVCSDITVFREIVGDSAEIISGWDKKTWANRIKSLLESPKKLKKLSIKGKKRGEKFNWKICAENTLECYKELTTD